MITLFSGYDCPGDGNCSNQGTCNDATGSCICNSGFEGNTCQGTYMMKELEICLVNLHCS